MFGFMRSEIAENMYGCEAGGRLLMDKELIERVERIK
jgi:hypothetical protein